MITSLLGRRLKGHGTLMGGRLLLLISLIGINIEQQPLLVGRVEGLVGGAGDLREGTPTGVGQPITWEGCLHCSY